MGLLDACAWVFGMYVAALLRFDFRLDRWSAGSVAIGWALAAGLQVGYGTLTGLYRRRWRFGSFEEVSAIVVTAMLVAPTLLIVSRFAFQPRLLPVSVAIGSGLPALIGIVAIRYLGRAWAEADRRPSGDDVEAVLVYGAGDEGAQLVTQMLRTRTSSLLPVAILDDDPARRSLRIRGVPVVGGREALGSAATRFGATKLIVAVAHGNAELHAELGRLGLAAGLDVAVLPPVDEILSGRPQLADLRPLDVRDLLGRTEVRTDLAQIAGYLTGRRVLVTGAGGSIGSELCHQLRRFSPSSLVMLDRDESALHGTQLRIERRALLDRRELVVADIRDRERLHEVFAEHRPEVVFHAAALKHLPLLELHPVEAVKTNVAGTRHLLELAAAFGTQRFVNVSTDKAADPRSVLGYSKRAAEHLTAAFGDDETGRFISVRFGNVLGSRGSVLETFHAQIDGGGPVTVTHPEVTRYFMTVEEAVQLVIQAGAIGRNREVLVLDMGRPIRIADVARQLITRSGRRIEIEFTGLRPGEKLHEVLFAADEVGVPLFHPLITHVAVPEIDPATLDPLPRTDTEARRWLADLAGQATRDITTR